MTQNNKKTGYYKILKKQYGETKQADAIWEVTKKRLQQSYPEKSEKEILAFMNSESGMRLATEILDGPGGITYAIAMMRVALLSKMKLARWWAYYYGVSPAPAPINRKMLYKSAIRNEMRIEAVRDLMINILGCKYDTIWPDPETWLDSPHTTEEELQLMWSYIQEVLCKGTTDNHNQEETE